MNIEPLPYGHPRLFDPRKLTKRQYEPPTAKEIQRCKTRRSVERIQDAMNLAKEFDCSIDEMLESQND